jgi:GNAT superfamily N-acetyltransferase
MTVHISQEQPNTAEAITLITELEAVLDPLYPSESRHGYNVDKLLKEGVAFFVLRADTTPAGCGGIQLVGTDYGELKRMYVRPEFRGRGFAKRIVDHLADYARAHGVDCLRLETGIYQVEAIRLYEGLGFEPIGPFGPYRPDPLSLFFEKRLP